MTNSNPKHLTAGRGEVGFQQSREILTAQRRETAFFNLRKSKQKTPKLKLQCLLATPASAEDCDIGIGTLKDIIAEAA